MPKQSEKRIKGRTQVNPQQTFDFTIPDRQVVARPVDAYERQYGSSRAKNIENFMESFSNMSKSAMQANEIYKTEQKEKGAVSAARGEDTPEGKHWAFVQGYESFKGEVAVNDYYAKLDSLFANAGQLEPDQWLAEKDVINRDFLNGRSDAFIAGFVPKAAELESKYDRKYHEVLKERVKNNYLTETRKMADLELTRIYNDPDITDKGRAVRNALSKEQARGKTLGMADRNDISKEFVQSYIEKAVTQGRPDFLDFAFAEDEAGFKLVQRPELADALWAGLRAANSKKIAIENKADEDLTKAKAEAVENMERTVVWAMETGKYEEAAQALVKGSPYINSEHTQTYLKRLNDLQLDANWSKKDNAEWYRAAYIEASEGKMSEASWTEAPKFCTRSTYMELAKVNANAKKAAAKDSEGNKSMFNEYKSILLKSVAPQDPFNMGAFIDGNVGRERNQEASHLMWMRLHNFTQIGNMKDLTPEILSKWTKEITADLNARMPAPSDQMLNENKGSKNKGGGSQSTLMNRLDEQLFPKTITPEVTP